MRWSTAFIPTLRDDPVEAEAPSHRLLLRAGYIRQLAAGHYCMLPLGQRVREKIIAIIKEEMDAIGAQEFYLPAMHPLELWEKTGRSSIDVLFHVPDGRGQQNVLGPTHEEVFTFLSDELQSYRDLPQSWYQVQLKFRDEARPKGGLLRVREFTMKDSYSFDIDQAGLDASFDAHKAAYERIFSRIGLNAIPVLASSGSMGGTGSMEFITKSNMGEDHIAHCQACGYAANVEKATSGLQPVDDAARGTRGEKELEQFPTPNVRTILDLVTFEGGAEAHNQIKTLVFMIDDALTLVLLRGDHEVMEQKLMDATAATTLRPAHPEEIRDALGASPGSLGAVGVSNLRVIADEALRERFNMTTGANIDNVHVRNVDVARDIHVDEWMDVRLVATGDACPKCAAPLDVFKGIESGHIFKLGYKYTDALNISVLGKDGKPVRPIMGCYGIGVERNMAAVVESHYDERGIIWPVAIAPYHVAVVALNADNADVMGAASLLYDELQSGGFDVLFDNREARAGVKLADVELVGIPVRVAIGARGIARRTVEVTVRATGETTEVALSDAAEYVDKLLSALSKKEASAE